jgi:hypothetical protein
MGRRLPNIILDTTLKKRDRESFKEFVLTVIEETFLYEFNPTTSELDINSGFFILVLENKRFIVDNLQVNNVYDYIDVYLFGVKQSQSRYGVTVDGDNIIITFTENITLRPWEVVNTDFIIKGKISDVVTTMIIP